MGEAVGDVDGAGDGADVGGLVGRSYATRSCVVTVNSWDIIEAGSAATHARSADSGKTSVPSAVTFGLLLGSSQYFLVYKAQCSPSVLMQGFASVRQQGDPGSVEKGQTPSSPSDLVGTAVGAGVGDDVGAVGAGVGDVVGSGVGALVGDTVGGGIVGACVGS